MSETYNSAAELAAAIAEEMNRLGQVLRASDWSSVKATRRANEEEKEEPMFEVKAVEVKAGFVGQVIYAHYIVRESRPFKAEYKAERAAYQTIKARLSELFN